MKKKVIAIATLVSVAAGFPCGAETLTWYGPEGGLWSTKGNWTNSVGEAAIPQNDDVLIIPSRTAAMTLENDIDGLTLKRIVFSGTGASVTLKGKAYSLDNTSFTMQNNNQEGYYTSVPFFAEGCVVTNEPAVTLKSSRTDKDRNSAICSSNNLTFVSTVSSDVPGKIYIEDPSGKGKNIRFLGSILAPSATIVGRASTKVYFDAPIHVKYVCYPDKYSAGWNIYFNAPGNFFEEIMIGPFGTFDFAAQNSIPSNTVLRWNYEYAGNRSSYYIHGLTVIDHVAAYDPPLTSSGAIDNGKYVISGYSDSLIMRSTTNLVTYAQFMGWMNLVWDPVDDYTCEFRDRTHDLKGYALQINRGRAVLSGMTVVKSVYLKISKNAVADFTATNGVVMPTTTSLEMGRDSRLYITNATVDAFTPGSTAVTLADGAFIEISAEAVSPTVKTVRAYDSIVPAGKYTGEDGVEGAVKVPWLRGSGVLTVANTLSTPAGQTHWKEPVSGDWSDSTKWTEGMPSSSRAGYVTALGGDYTVTVTNVAALAKGLVIGSCARLDVRKEGVCRIGGAEDSLLKIKPGAELIVSGGTCILTNHVMKNMSIAGTAAQTATVSVTSGRFVALRDSENLFRVGDYAALNVSGGEVVIDNAVGYQTPYHRISVAPEGRVNFSGTGKLRISRSYTGAPFGSGATTFSDDASFVPVNEVYADRSDGESLSSGPNFGVYAERPGETAVLTFKGRAMHEHILLGHANCQVGGYDTDSVTCRTIANFNSSAIHGSCTNGVYIGTSTIAAKAFVGCGNGYGELNVTDGFVMFGNYGTRIGSVVNTTTSDTGDSLGCTGVCNVAGGEFVTVGARAWDPTPVPAGMLVGWGWPTLSELERPYNGFMNVTGGIVSNTSCSTVIGAGKGYGEWRQKGGKTILVAEGVKVGLAGGIGLISVSGGTFTSTNDTYIGGAPVTAFIKGNKLADIGYPTNRHDGVGTLTVSGGRFEVKGNSTSKLYVGADGEGTVEMDGPDGELVVPQLVLAAGTVDAGTENEAQTKATLRFKLDANGRVAPITVTSTLTISDDSELVIDATACPDNVFGRFNLINTGSVSGDFDPSNITVLGAPKIVWGTSVAWRGKSLFLSLGKRAMTVIIR